MDAAALFIFILLAYYSGQKTLFIALTIPSILGLVELAYDLYRETNRGE